MAQPKAPLRERIAPIVKELSATSKEVSTASEELNQAIAALDKLLATFNLGIAAWHEVAGNVDDDGTYWSRDIGYTRVGSQWRIALRTTTGNQTADVHNEEVWPFKDAPKWMCIEGVSQLPDLLTDLNKRSLATLKKLKVRSGEVREFVDMFGAVIAEEDSSQK